MISPVTPSLFMLDFETDGITLDAKPTELTLRINQTVAEEKNYFTAYFSKPDDANYARPFQKKIPHGQKRYDENTCLSKASNFIRKNLQEGQSAVLMGYNVKGWDEPVLRAACARSGVTNMPWDKMTFFDLAEVAHHLGFPMGTTQQQLEVAIGAEGLPANRHRALADVKVMNQIWKRMLRNIEPHPERMAELNAALSSTDPESAAAKVLLKYDRSLNASRTTLDWIAETKKAEKSLRQEIFVLIDTETTGLLPKERSHHDTAIRVIEFGAKILSPYSGDAYEESFESFVNPGEGAVIAPGATAVHGITAADLVGKPSMGKVAESFMTWVKTSNTYQRILSERRVAEEPRIVLIGYNNSGYDNALIEEELLLSGIDFKRLINKKVLRSYDAMHLMSTLYTGEAKKPVNNTMQEHARFLDIPEDSAHRALGDVRTLERILRKICGSINPVLILSEAMNFPASPGKAAKAILKNALPLLRTARSPEHAVKQSVHAYEVSLAEQEASSSSSAPTIKKRRKNQEPLPASQDFLSVSQDLTEQIELI